MLGFAGEAMRRTFGLAPSEIGSPSEEEQGASDRMDAEALYRAHATFVAKLLYRMGAREQELEDLVQQVFLVAHNRGGYAIGPAQPTTWLAGIAIRVLSTHRRTIRRKKLSDPASNIPLDELVDEGVDAHRHAEARESLERVARALDKLSDEQRLVFVLHEIEERSCDALAEELSLPLGTVHSRLFAARRAFQEAHRRELKQTPTKSSGRAPSGQQS